MSRRIGFFISPIPHFVDTTTRRESMGTGTDVRVSIRDFSSLS